MLKKIDAIIRKLEDDKSFDYHPRFRIEKKELLDIAFSKYDIKSAAELGCVWGIDCSYGIYALEKFKLNKVKMVDTHWTDTAMERVSNYPEIEVFKDNFGAEHMPQSIGNVDAVILFDVLLHQVAPDWTRLLEMYACHAEYFIIFNQDWIKSNLTTRLLDLGEEEYFKNVPHNINEAPYNTLFDNLYEKHPLHDRIWRDVHHVWQWGIVSDDLISVMKKLGFRLEYFSNHGELSYLKSFEEHSYIFKKIR
ncbi:MAG: class I SAM-dependent methyltransferase [Sulfurimonas sp.]|nr:class I SAM-dependent methyltransferase [Sulfurimonas sp.]MBU3938362.1 class I SAM-dependent methyltransferase [bacterium]MBU4025071.1 class I SAM-dependent methyltransferase [bacterium]MBU4058504.1 class I SAM-dependent methyltransferase [bacterium]MBU4110581.1 class I SAM-dependent methyltransferase [bacterium]